RIYVSQIILFEPMHDCRHNMFTLICAHTHTHNNQTQTHTHPHTHTHTHTHFHLLHRTSAYPASVTSLALQNKMNNCLLEGRCSTTQSQPNRHKQAISFQSSPL